MLERVLEPEVMDTVEEALDYDSMDHAGVNRVFADDFLELFHSAGLETTEQLVRILDVGTGTAQIPIELCGRSGSCHVTAVDLAGEMLKVAADNVEQAGFSGRINLERIDAKQLPFENGAFDAVISNSIVHHIPEPKQVIAEMLRVTRPGGVLFVRDLLRPDDVAERDRLVVLYAGEANFHQQKMFRDSLHAALTLKEIRGILDELDSPVEWVRQTTDRHWTMAGCLESV